MANERVFWEKMLSTANPNWNTAAGPDFEFGGGGLADIDTFIYVLDARSGWITAAAIKSKDFQAIRDKFMAEIASSPVRRGQLTNIAAHKIIEGGQVQGASNSELSLQAVVGATYALASTNTFDMVRQATGNISGHWMYIVYSTTSNTLIGRPAYASGPSHSFMGGEQLKYMISQTIQRDIDNPETSVGRQLIESGGVVLHESLRSPPGHEGDEYPSPRD